LLWADWFLLVEVTVNGLGLRNLGKTGSLKKRRGEEREGEGRGEKKNCKLQDE
jgi:hypothetical protein